MLKKSNDKRRPIPLSYSPIYVLVGVSHRMDLFPSSSYFERLIFSPSNAIRRSMSHKNRMLEGEDTSLVFYYYTDFEDLEPLAREKVQKERTLIVKLETNRFERRQKRNDEKVRSTSVSSKRRRRLGRSFLSCSSSTRLAEERATTSHCG